MKNSNKHTFTLIQVPSNENLESIFREDTKAAPKPSMLSAKSLLHTKYNEISLFSTLIQYRFDFLLSEKGKASYLKIQSFGNLEDNWDSYRAEAPKNHVIQNALIVLRFLDYRSIAIYHTVPTPRGGIGIEVVNGKKSIEMEITKDNTIDYACFVGDEVEEEKEIQMIHKDEIFPVYALDSPLQKIIHWLN